VNAFAALVTFFILLGLFAIAIQIGSSRLAHRPKDPS